MQQHGYGTQSELKRIFIYFLICRYINIESSLDIIEDVCDDEEEDDKEGHPAGHHLADRGVEGEALRIYWVFFLTGHIGIP